MRDVILVRTDLPQAIVSFSNPQSANYANYISVPTGSTYGAIDFKRGWASIDIKLLGHPVARFVDTHLESAATGYRQAQAAELVGAFGTGPLLNPSFPAIIAGDLNSDPSIIPTGDPASGLSDGAAFGIIAGAGFVDSGNTTNTFGHNANVNEFPSNVFSERIDHIMFRPGGFTSHLTNKVVGTDPANRTPGGLWPSDHAGLIVGIG
jgi:endonuclease/exonuclease/phosphatase family metal-dependent hydrolase